MSHDLNTDSAFREGCARLIALNPQVYKWSDLKFWTHSQLAEALAEQAMIEDAPGTENFSP